MTPEEIIERNNKLYHPEMDAKYVRLEAAIKSINDYNRAFKSELREEVEKEREMAGRSGSSVNFKQGYFEALIWIDEKLNSLTPKK
ncbi:MAG TPA: hypothetical protein VFZ33_01070 [Chitinophagaceae bacterium]